MYKKKFFILVALLFLTACAETQLIDLGKGKVRVEITQPAGILGLQDWEIRTDFDCSSGSCIPIPPKADSFPKKKSLQEMDEVVKHNLNLNEVGM